MPVIQIFLNEEQNKIVKDYTHFNHMQSKQLAIPLLITDFKKAGCLKQMEMAYLK